MTRLADLVLNSRSHANLLAAPPHGIAPGDATAAATVPVIVADNVSQFLFAGSPQENWEFGRDFPDCTLPCSPLFVEMARPSRVISHVHGVNDAALLPDRWGWRFEATGRDSLEALLHDAGCGPTLEHYYRRYVDLLAGSGLVDVEAVERALDAPDPVEAARRLDHAGAGYFAAVAICRALGRLKAGAGHDERGGLGWLLHGSLVIERDGRVVGPVATLDLILDREGRPVPPPLFDASGGDEFSFAEKAVLRATVMPLVFPALLALSFANTEGVSLRAVEPPPDLARRHEEQGLHAPLPYQILDLGAVAGVDRN